MAGTAIRSFRGKYTEFLHRELNYSEPALSTPKNDNGLSTHRSDLLSSGPDNIPRDIHFHSSLRSFWNAFQQTDPYWLFLHCEEKNQKNIHPTSFSGHSLCYVILHYPSLIFEDKQNRNNDFWNFSCEKEVEGVHESAAGARASCSGPDVLAQSVVCV